MPQTGIDDCPCMVRDGQRDGSARAGIEPTQDHHWSRGFTRPRPPGAASGERPDALSRARLCLLHVHEHTRGLPRRDDHPRRRGAAEADTSETSRNILLGQIENLLYASGWKPLLVARLEEERGHTAEAREAYEQTGTTADVRRILHKQAEWEEAAALDGDNADLEWLLDVDRLAAARPAGLGARLYEQERRRLAETLEKMRYDDSAGA